MYEDEKYTINWLKLFLVLLIAFLVVILSLKLVSIIIRNRDSKGLEVKMQDNLKLLDETAKGYLKGDKLPKKIGNTNKYSLQKLKDDGVIDVIKDESGKECDMSKSYVEATRLETEYQIKSYLVCNGESNYTNSFVSIEEQEKESEDIIIVDDSSVITPDEENNSTEIITKDNTTTTTNTTTKEKPTTTTITTTTKEVTTRKQVRKYTIGYNTNGGELIDEIRVSEGEVIPSVTPVRKGYKFVGWFYHGERFDFNTKVYQDYVLVAKWIKE